MTAMMMMMTTTTTTSTTTTTKTTTTMMMISQGFNWARPPPRSLYMVVRHKFSPKIVQPQHAVSYLPP